MNKIVSVLIVGLVLVISSVSADDRHYPEKEQVKAQAGQDMGQGMDMMDMKKMHEHMKEMQGVMDDANKSDDPQERQRLMQAHMEKMHEMMGGMRGMMGEGKMMSGDSSDDKKMEMQMGSTSMSQRLEMMGQRMDMMQVMMEQMMAQMMMQQKIQSEMNK